MVLSFLRGLSSEAELNRIIAKLAKLDTKPASKLAQSRWILSEGILTRLLKTARKALKSRPALLRDVPSPCIVVGDLHGDIHTLIRILKHNGMPPKARYLFLGDYVDRGANGVEVLALILALHCRHPGHVHCLRGNHESGMMSRAYGFLAECRTRYSTRIYAASLAVFNVLPVAAVVGGAVFAVHGGITPRLGSLDDIDAIPRPAKLEPDSLLADLIWGDPVVNAGIQDYAASDRGAGHLFGQRVYAAFLERHGFAAMVRAHEVCRRGCRRAFGTCWTVFSHPQYLGLTNAAGALVIHADNSFEPQAFAATAEDLDALEGHPLDAEDEQQVDAVPRCMESVMLDSEDGEERAAAIKELEELGAEVLGLQVGSTSTHGSEQCESPDGDAAVSQSGESGLSTPGPVRTPATSDVQTHALASAEAASIEALMAALPSGSMLPTGGLPATPVPAIDVDACAVHSAGAGAPDGTGEISLSPSPARHRIAVAASGGAADEAAAAAPNEATASSGATHPVATAAAPATAAVPIELRAPSAAPLEDDGPELSGSPASVAYALAARAGLPTALARPLTAAAGHAFGKVVSPVSSAPRADPAWPVRGALRSSPPTQAHPMFLSFGTQRGLVSPLQVAAGASAVEPALKASASCSEADAGEHELMLFDVSASAGACELSRPDSPVGGAWGALGGGPGCSPTQPASPLARPQQEWLQVAPRKVPDALAATPSGHRGQWHRSTSGKSGTSGTGTTSGSVEGGDSACFGRTMSFHASATTLAAVSGLTDEPDALS